ncbi:MAG: glutathione S-transferase C-terminal domain-containing protein, partial [Steroidobacteraceae bacterium]|nr:glutathione S-transferase C-terminal domain-containing protein [Steroidobacteraceae bacterium]
PRPTAVSPATCRPWPTKGTTLSSLSKWLYPASSTPKPGEQLRLNFISTEVHKGFGPLWNPQTPADVRERAVQALGNRFTFIAKTLEQQPFLTGDAFSIADAYLWVVLNWADYHKVDLTPWPAVQQFRARVAARPAVQATLKAEGLVK